MYIYTIYHVYKICTYTCLALAIYIYIIYIYFPIMILARPFKKRLYQCDRPNVKHMSEFSKI